MKEGLNEFAKPKPRNSISVKNRSLRRSKSEQSLKNIANPFKSHKSKKLLEKLIFGEDSVD